MSPLAEWEAAQLRLERRRWVRSTAVVLLCGVVLAAVWLWRFSAGPVAVPSALPMVVELAPAPHTPAAASAQPAGPRQQEVPRPKPPQPRSVSRIETPKPAQIALPDTPPAEPERKPQEDLPAPQTTAPPSDDALPADRAAAPRQSEQSLATSTAELSFRERLLGHLQRYKRYPPAAQMRRQQGVPYIRFAMDRAGRVLASRLERSSGYAVLDAEALALLQRAQPLPALPDDITGDTLEIVVPIEYFLAR